MARKPLLGLRIEDVTKERWTAAARDRGYSLSEFVRACVEAELGTTPAKKQKEPPAPRRRSRPGESAGDLASAFRGPDPK